MANDPRLGQYLKDRRARLDPAALGFASARRRTPGLRREEVAQRASISPTWYTWLEQGRGGAPSAEVLERLAQALLLTDVEREHLFLLGLGQRPGPRYPSHEAISPRLQRVLDALAPNPALLKTLTWDVAAWNRPAAVVLTDYGRLPPEQRNILRLMFLDGRVRNAQHDWESVARFVVETFRADITRAGATERAQPLIDELLRGSADFARLWATTDVRQFGAGRKQLHHPEHGPLSLEFSSFVVEGRADLSMLVYMPSTAEDAARIQALLDAAPASTRATPSTALAA